MDFLVLSTLVGVVIIFLTISYDIACQWSRNIKKRMPRFPSFMQIPPNILNGIKYVILKFHIYGHGSKCQTQFSLNFLKHSAHTDGEEPERWWAHINPVSMSTREMGLGARHDTIDDHVAAWNWRKIVNLGECLVSSYLTFYLLWDRGHPAYKAVKMKSKHNDFHVRFTAKLSPEVAKKWGTMVDAWDLDQTKVNPYEEMQKGLLFVHLCLNALNYFQFLRWPKFTLNWQMKN
jgi:hypothetical protein